MDNNIKTITLPNNLLHIGRYAFNGNQIEGLILPNNIQYIGESAFSNTAIKNITLPNTLRYLGAYAFNNTYLESFILPTPESSGSWHSESSYHPDGTVINKDLLRESFIYTEYTDEYYTLTNDDVYVTDNTLTAVFINRPNIIIPYQLHNQVIKSINHRVFQSHHLQKVILPDSLETIGYNAFSNNFLKEITLPDNLKRIDSDAFKNNQLSSIEVPQGIESISGRAFEGNNLTEIVLPESLSYIGYSCFKDNKLTKITIPNKVTHIYSSTFENNALKEVLLPNTITSIEERAFKNNLIEEIHLPDSLKQIETSAFEKNNIKTISFPDKLQKIEENAFYTNQLSSISFPSSLEFIGDNTFSNNKIETINFSNGLIYIGKNAFSNNSISSFQLPQLPSKAGFQYHNWIDNNNETHQQGEMTTSLSRAYKTNYTYTGALVSVLIEYPKNFAGVPLNDELLVDINVSGDVTDYEKGASYSFITDKGQDFTITPVKEGYTFIPSNLAVSDIQKDILHTFKAIPITYNITYHNVDGENENPKTYLTNNYIRFTDVNKEGYLFEGWYTDENFTSPPITDIPSGTIGDLNLYAKWKVDDNINSIVDYSPQLNIKLYPNPVKNHFSINIKVNKLNIFNLNGQLVKSFNKNAEKYNISELKTGLYIVNVHTKNGVVKRKLAIK